jgi:hypothetical protein
MQVNWLGEKTGSKHTRITNKQTSGYPGLVNVQEQKMSDNTNRVEQHGCIVCGKLYNLLVVYAPSGKMVDFTVVSPGGRTVPDAVRPLVSCNIHSESEVETALAKHYPGMEQPEDRED